jgi:uncharacterized protein
VAPAASIDEKRQRLIAELRSYESCAVAFSGGVDSAVVAQAAHLALGQAAVAVTGNSHSLAQGELSAAHELATSIGIRHVVIETQEFASESYLRNAPDRCYHCKSELYSQLASRLEELGVKAIASGANVDDLGDYRPGLQAAQEHQVRHPLANCQIGKADVRELARLWKLAAWDKPAAPCLSSRVAYGEEVTPARLEMIDRAEQYLRGLGLREVRVRYHRGDMARLEAPLSSLVELCREPTRTALIAELKRCGFKFVTLDLEGFRSGSLNRLIPIESLLK